MVYFISNCLWSHKLLAYRKIGVIGFHLHRLFDMAKARLSESAQLIQPPLQWLHAYHSFSNLHCRESSDEIFAGVYFSLDLSWAFFTQTEAQTQDVCLYIFRSADGLHIVFKHVSGFPRN